MYVRSLPAARVRVTHVIRVGTSDGTGRTRDRAGPASCTRPRAAALPGSDQAMPTGPTISPAISAAGRVLTSGRQTPRAPGGIQPDRERTAPRKGWYHRPFGQIELPNDPWRYASGTCLCRVRASRSVQDHASRPLRRQLAFEERQERMVRAQLGISALSRPSMIPGVAADQDVSAVSASRLAGRSSTGSRCRSGRPERPASTACCAGSRRLRCGRRSWWRRRRWRSAVRPACRPRRRPS